MRTANCGWRIAVAALGAAGSLGAQSVLYRSANLGGTWVVPSGIVQFNFVHRFYVSPGPSHTVVNDPTFTLAAGVVRTVDVGVHFATHSFIIGSGAGSQSTNETEAYARWRVWGGDEGSQGFHLAATPAYNFLAKSVDAELGLDWTSGPLTLEGAARLASKALGKSESRAALGGGVVARLNRYIGVAADAGAFTKGALATWSAAVNFAIPGSPHTFSLEVSNALSSTIQGNSVGQTTKLYGFEFTIPLDMKRFGQWFHRPAPAGPPAGSTIGATVHARSFKFDADTVTITVGQTVVWSNADPVDHTVTFDGAGPSGTLPGDGVYYATFATPGVYPYHCTPHPYMKGVVVVK